MWTKREFPMGRVDMLMENDKAVPHQTTISTQKSQDRCFYQSYSNILSYNAPIVNTKFSKN